MNLTVHWRSLQVDMESSNPTSYKSAQTLYSSPYSLFHTMSQEAVKHGKGNRLLMWASAVFIVPASRKKQCHLNFNHPWHFPILWGSFLKLWKKEWITSKWTRNKRASLTQLREPGFWELLAFSYTQVSWLLVGIREMAVAMSGAPALGSLH